MMSRWSRPARGDREAAVADHDGGHPERRRRRRERIPGELGVVVRVDVHDARREGEPARVDPLRGGAQLAAARIAADRRDAAVLDGEAAVAGGSAEAIDDARVLDHEVVCHVSVSPWHGVRGHGCAPAAAPFFEHGLGVERAQGRWRPGGRGAVGAGDLGIDGGDPVDHVRLGAKGPDLVEHAVGLGADLESRGQDRELLALEELLDPPHRIIRLLDAGDGPALALEPVELAVPLGVLDLFLDP